jgi:hypothetical protein
MTSTGHPDHDDRTPTSATHPQAGWHADPADAMTTRYWDGARWTATRRWTGTSWVDVPTELVASVAAALPIGATTATTRSGAKVSGSKVLAAAAAVFVGALVLINCGGGGGGGGGGSLRSDLAGAIVKDSDGEVGREDAECIADRMIDEGYTREDHLQVSTSEDGIAVSSQLLDMFTDAVVHCSPDLMG